MAKVYPKLVIVVDSFSANRASQTMMFIVMLHVCDFVCFQEVLSYV